MAAVTAVAVVLLVDTVAGDEPSFAPSTVRPPATADLSRYWVERVAAKVLPSVVTLQISDGDQSQLGSGVILDPRWADHDQQPCRGGGGPGAARAGAHRGDPERRPHCRDST